VKPEMKVHLKHPLKFKECNGGIFDQALRCGQGFIVVYDITDRNSFLKVDHYIKKIYDQTEEINIPIMLVGNKCDLKSDRNVSIEEGKEKAEKYQNVKFFETSAKCSTNLEEMYYCLVMSVDSFKPTNHIESGFYTSGGGNGIKNQKNCLLM
jgi:GTPase SAR1 family protein